MVAPAHSPGASQVEMTQLVLPSDANALGTAFGGKLMQWIDVAAAVAARRHSGTVAVTASIDSLHFERPVQQGDVVVLLARVNRVWRSSMEVGVRVEGETLSPGGPPSAPIGAQRFHAATAYLTFVAIDAEGRRLDVPPIVPTNAEDQRRYEAADTRRAARLRTRDARRHRAAESSR